MSGPGDLPEDVQGVLGAVGKLMHAVYTGKLGEGALEAPEMRAVAEALSRLEPGETPGQHSLSEVVVQVGNGSALDQLGRLVNNVSIQYALPAPDIVRLLQRGLQRVVEPPEPPPQPDCV